MKLPQEFIRLPLQFDSQRLAEEVAALPSEAWLPHPTGFKGNTAVPLISVNGEPNDEFAGPMKTTPWLEHCPYIRQVLASFQVVFGRSRLMCLDGGSKVPNHSDVNYHWFTRVRIHIPVVTFPEVEFHCQDKMVNMAAGEAWIFDNWKMHSVLNPTQQKRVHLVADTMGSGAFWGMADQALEAAKAGQVLNPQQIAYDPSQNPQLAVEKFNSPDVMQPNEVESLAEDLLEDLQAGNNPQQMVNPFVACVRAFCRDWRMLWTLYGPEEEGWQHYAHLRNQMLRQLSSFRQPLVLSSNGLMAQKVIYARILIACVNRPMPQARA